MCVCEHKGEEIRHVSKQSQHSARVVFRHRMHVLMKSKQYTADYTLPAKWSLDRQRSTRYCCLHTSEASCHSPHSDFFEYFPAFKGELRKDKRLACIVHIGVLVFLLVAKIHAAVVYMCGAEGRGRRGEAEARSV